MMVLYKLDVVPGGDVDDAVAEFRAEHGFELPRYAAKLVQSVVRSQGEIDEVLTRHLQEWSLSRLGAVERSILRIAACELRDGLVPQEVAIDEAVELAKRYASPEAAKLVNGVLGALVRGGDAAPPAT
jgi:transcription antitermination protein NusB